VISTRRPVAVPAKDKLPYGVVSASKWGKTTLALTFFSGFYLREALLNRLQMFGEYFQVECVVSTKSRKNFEARQLAARKKILDDFKDSRNLLFKRLKITSKVTGPLSYAQVASRTSALPKAVKLSKAKDVVSKPIPTTQKVKTKKQRSPDSERNLVEKLKLENAQLNAQVSKLSSSVSELSKAVQELQCQLTKCIPAAPKEIKEQAIKVVSGKESATDAGDRKQKKKSSSKSTKVSAPTRKSPRLNTQAPSDSKHSTSLENSQPSNDAQDGPVLNLFISRHSTSLSNPQTFEISQDGPTSSSSAQPKLTCQIQGCPAKKGYAVRGILDHYLNCHHQEMLLLPLSYWEQLALSGLTVCHSCKHIWSAKKSSCPSCGGTLMNSANFTVSDSTSSDPEDTPEAEQSSTEHRPQALTWLKDRSWDDLISFTKHMHLRADLNERIYALLSDALYQCLLVVQEACESENQAKMDLAFKLLYIFPSCVLRKPKRSRNGSKSSVSINRFTKDLCSRWISCDYEALFAQALDGHEKRVFSQRQISSKSNAKRAEQLLSLYRISDAVKALQFRGFDSSESAAESLMEKHPPRQASTLEDRNDLVKDLPEKIFKGSLTITADEVLGSIKSFPRGTAVGFSGLSPLHLLRCCDTPTIPHIGQKCLRILTSVLNYMIRGIFPSNAAPYFFGAKLVGINKKDGGIRPIAIGEILRRLISKIVLQKIDFPFAPFQFGIKKKLGMEIIAHSLKRIYDSSKADKEFWKDYVVLKVDLANAFNNVSRDGFLKIIDHCLPELSSFAKLVYDQQSFLHFGDTVLHSAEGVQQGDPLGPAFFCFVLQALILRIQSTCPELTLNSWYMDDGVLVGKATSLLKVLEVIQGFGFGFKLNLKKCEIFPLDADADLSCFPVEMERITRLSNLGVPISHEAWFASSRVQKLVASLMELECIEHKQSAVLLLKHCFGPLKLNHILRCSPTHAIAAEIEEMDKAQLECLDNLLRSRITPSGFEQAHFSSLNGGLGLKLASRIAPAAYLGSHISSSEEVTELLKERIPKDSGHLVDPERVSADMNSKFDLSFTLDQGKELYGSGVTSLQGHISDLIETSALAKFQLTLSDEDLDWLRNVSKFSHWVDRIPSKLLGTYMDNVEYVTAVQFRLRSVDFLSGSMCVSGEVGKSRAVLLNAHHCTGCPVGGGIHNRHALLAKTVFEEAEGGALQPVLEASLSSENQSRAGDVYIENWHRGKGIALDVCVVAQPRFKPNSSAKDYSKVMEDRYQAKVKMHDANCRKVNVMFAPLVFSTGGDVHPKSLPILHRLADLRAQRQGISSTTARQLFLDRLGVMIQKGNALGIISHQQRAIFIERARKGDTEGAMEHRLSRCPEGCRYCKEDALEVEEKDDDGVESGSSGEEVEAVMSGSELEERDVEDGAEAERGAAGASGWFSMTSFFRPRLLSLLY
jgi:hypothetical protein